MNKKTIKPPSLAWQQYEAGLEYKRRIGLYETVRQNERFYRGDQWLADREAELPRPVFNVLRRIVDYLVCAVASGSLNVSYTDLALPFISDSDIADKIKKSLELLTLSTSYTWERSHMDSRLYSLLQNAALSGDGVIYCWWNPDTPTGQPLSGDISIELIDNVNLFVADVNRADIQSQDYIILSGRASVSSLREEARRAGADESTAALIRPDSDTSGQSGDMSRFEVSGKQEEKATFIIKFHREGGKVVFEKSVRDAVIRRAITQQTLYPVAYFNWYPTKNCFHGTSPITGMIPNQKFINQAFAMVMKHMTDTAFSKVIYDKTKIPEWSNRVGEAIAAVGATNVSDAVSVVGAGELQDGYLELIKLAIDMTKDMMGATETALGNGQATNTSAILALQEASKIPLEQVRRAYFQCVEDIANIWADMMCAHYSSSRLLPFMREGVECCGKVDFDLLRDTVLRARVEVGEITRFSASGSLSLLNRLLDGGHITAAQYIERLPSGIIANRTSLIEQMEQMEVTE